MKIPGTGNAIRTKKVVSFAFPEVCSSSKSPQKFDEQAMAGNSPNLAFVLTTIANECLDGVSSLDSHPETSLDVSGCTHSQYAEKSTRKLAGNYARIVTRIGAGKTIGTSSGAGTLVAAADGSPTVSLGITNLWQFKPPCLNEWQTCITEMHTRVPLVDVLSHLMPLKFCQDINEDFQCLSDDAPLMNLLGFRRNDVVSHTYIQTILFHLNQTPFLSPHQRCLLIPYR